MDLPQDILQSSRSMSPTPSRSSTPSPKPKLAVPTPFYRKHGMKLLMGASGAALGYGVKKLIDRIKHNDNNKFTGSGSYFGTARIRQW